MENLITKIKEMVEVDDFSKKRNDLFFMTVKEEQIELILSYLKENEGFKDLSFLQAVDYIEDNFTEPADKREKLDFDRTHGLISPKNYVQQMTGNETVKDDAEAIEFINENLDLFTQIKGIPNEGVDGARIDGDASESYEPSQTDGGED